MSGAAAAATDSEAGGAMPLAGIRVLDLSNLLAGPMTSMHLADFGAEVIKVEHPVYGDELRQWGNAKDGVGLYFKVINRNKRLITVNLSESRGQEMIRELAKDVDVLVENFRVGRLEQWGLDYETLRGANPGIVVAHITGYGRTGPYAERPGFGTIAEAFSGYAAITGYEDGPPLLPSFGLADSTTSIFAAFGILTALRERDRTGEGQEIDSALYEGLLTLLGPQVIDYDQLDLVQGREGSRLPFVAPRNTFETADGQWFALAGGTARTFSRIVSGLGRDDLVDDPRFATNRDRMKNADELEPELRAAISERTLAEMLELFEAAEAPGGPVNDVSQVIADGHVQTRGNITEIEDEELGTVRMQAVVPKLSRTPGQVRHAGRPKGADNAEVFERLLSLSAEELNELEASGVV